MGDQPSVGETPANPPQDDGPRDEASERPGWWKRFAAKLPRKGILALASATFTAIVATVVASMVLGWLPWWHSAKSAGPTSRIVFQPWTLANKISSDIHVASRVTGYCWTESIAAPRLDAYRCLEPERNIILDPCFGDPFGSAKEVVCAYPTPESVTIIQLTRQLPVFSASHFVRNAWLIVLADGEDCSFATGGTANPVGLRLNYDCGNRLLYGNINRTNRIWTILEQHNGSSDMIPVPIATAYY
jgi:hypothetical protein